MSNESKIVCWASGAMCRALFLLPPHFFQNAVGSPSRFRRNASKLRWYNEDDNGLGGIALIEVSHLTKRYGQHVAVDDISFTIEPGKIYGFLGPNGAGKSTTMNIMTGCLAATAGSVKIDGHDIFEEPLEAKRRLGYLPEQPPVYADMTVRDYLHFVAEVRRIPPRERKDRIAAAMARTGVADVSERLIRNLSKGYRQRVGLAQAILGDPEFVVLDEPTVGLDPKQIIEIRDLIKSLGREHTVLLSSHIMQEISAVCDYILIISRGQLVASGTPEELEARALHGHAVNLTVRAAEPQLSNALKGLGVRVEKVCASQDEPGALDAVLWWDGEEDRREAIFYALASARLPVLAMAAERMSLEAVFLQMTADAEHPSESENGQSAADANKSEEKEAAENGSDL